MRPVSKSLPLLIFLLAALAPLAAPAADTWTKLNKNPENNAFQNQAATVTALTTGSQVWTSQDYSLFSGAGAIMNNGSVYTVRQEGAATWGNLTDDKIYVVSLRAETGGRYWQSPALVAGNSVDYWSSSTPTYDAAENAVYIGTGDTVQKLSAATGLVLASLRLTSATTGNVAGSYDIINSSPAIGGNLLFIETYGGNVITDKQLVALNKTTLAKVWAVKDGGLGNGTPCYVATSSTQYIYTALSKGVACYNAATGALVWKSSTLASPWSMTYDVAASLVYDSGNLFVTSNDLATYTGKGEILCVDAATGAKKWTAPKTIGWVSVPPVVVSGKVYVKGGNSMTLWGFDVATGNQLFSNVIGGSSFATCLAATTNRIYTTNGSKLFIIDPATGSPLATLADAAYDGPVLLDAKGALYTHLGGKLRAFGPVVPVALSQFRAD